MTNLNSVLKSKEIILPTKVHIVKAMVFPVSHMDVRARQQRRESTKEMVLLNCGVGENS